MNTLLTLLFTLLAVPSSFRMMVISDPHVLDSTLFDVNSASMKSQMETKLNQEEYAQAAFIQLVDKAMEVKPDVVLIPGDMTMNGSRVSHQSVVDQLHRLTNENIKVCLIPGNHDINNSNAAKYLGTNKESIPSISSAEFDSLYAFLNADFPNRRQDPNSHSYVLTLAPRLTLIGADCTVGSYSGDAGVFTESTLKWICDQADSAVAMGDRVIAMMHYQLLEHTDEFGTLFPQALVDDYETVAQTFRQHGIELVLTGHMHYSNVSTNYLTTNRDSLVEISTGTPIMYPSPYRMITFSNKWSQLQCETKHITSLPNNSTFSEANNKQHVSDIIQNVKLRDLYDLAWEYRNDVDSLVDNLEIDKTTNTLLGIIGLSKDDIKELSKDLIAVIPSDSKERADYINGFVGTDVSTAAIIHIKGNEGETNTEALKKSIIKDIYDLAEALIWKAYPNSGSLSEKFENWTKREKWLPKIEKAYKTLSPYEEKSKLSIIENLDVVEDVNATIQDFLDGFFGDYTYYKDEHGRQNRTDDLRPTLRFVSLPQRDYYATVFYKLNGFGEDFVDSVLINEPVAIPQPQDPTYDSMAFMGWYSDSELTQKYDFSTIINAENDVTITLYAKWLPVITFALGDTTKLYDGTPTGIKYKYKGSLPKSCTTQVEVDTILTNADSVIYHVTKTTILFNKEDVTNNYFITWTPDSARMVITPRTIYITTATDSMTYNGLPLTAQDTTMSGDGFVASEGIDITYTGSQTEVGSSDNTIEYTALEGTILNNYNINVEFGQLIVTEVRNITSELENPKTDQLVEKLIINHQLYIRKNGVLYNALGVTIK